MTRLIAITGANRGFGRSVAVSLAKTWPGADFLLSMRESSKGMEVTEEEVKKVGGGKVVRWMLDISGREVEAQTAAGLASVGEYEEVLLVNNAATLGSMAAVKELRPSDIAEGVATNATSCMVLTSTFLKTCTSKKITVVNVASTLGINPCPGFSLYCSVKALRDMFHKCIAEDHPTIRTLNYSPGPMDTGMQQDIRTNHTHSATREQFTSLKTNNTIVDPYHSAEMLALVLTDGAYSNGQFIDYADVLQKKGIPQRRVKA